MNLLKLLIITFILYLGLRFIQNTLIQNDGKLPGINQMPTPKSVNPTPNKINRETVKVTFVYDGDTIEIEGGRKVRYIGIDAPENNPKENKIECFGKEATQKNFDLVQGKTVELSKDTSETDTYGRLLRYVWVSGVFVNQELVRQGYAYAVAYPPDVSYQLVLNEAQREARNIGIGIWSACPKN